MSEPFVAEIKLFAGNFAPRGYALCDGQLLPIAQYQALFSLLGTTYGGDGRTTFGLPDLRGRAPVHAGTGPGLSYRPLGSKGGYENHTLVSNEMASHNHPANCSSAEGSEQSPVNGVWAKEAGGATATYSAANGDEVMRSTALGNTGGGQPHNNMQPFLAVYYIIALQGIFPPRN